MGFLSRRLDRIEARIERPADPGVLGGGRNPGSGDAARAADQDGAVAAARRARRERARRRWRWGSR
ncbi:MAG: hypothetical protein BroJett022_12470 [Actinomycetes bacterium]|nr:MAG: hypothetical protein BroJett022_12470 [Actinomycetes bacterium]